MECSYETVNDDDVADPGRKIVRNSPYPSPRSKVSSPWFDMRVFYVRISNCEVDSSTPEYLTLNHIPLSPDTLLEVNGVRSSIYSDGVSSLLRRDRVDKKSEEATFVSTDSIRMTGSVKFEVFDREDLVLSGVLEMSNSNGFIGESKNHSKQWSMDCQSEITAGSIFLKGKQSVGSELYSPTIEVYVAGCFSGTPIILTKTLQLNFRRKHTRKGMLDSIPEYDTTESKKDVQSELALQISGYRDYKPDNEEDFNNMYSREDYIEGEDGELSWFNAGVRVGVGIGLGICLGVGIGVGLLVRTYQTTTRTFKRRLV
ncbi:hypothetical protein BVC80_1117g7 [Macleaya cordata]|uniref:Erythronate-4-phosphate dehydrogenase family protein n=1 Tax=Macleaya cordata TaxID=56857 RepID=A0A200Q962_MACCD|nr:hypothetical protein BVC80_1117g7 [Macleaya cordata]